MADRRPLLFKDGVFQELPVNEDVRDKKLIIYSDTFKSYQEVNSYADLNGKRPLICLNGHPANLPLTDTLIGVPLAIDVDKAQTYLISCLSSTVLTTKSHKTFILSNIPIAGISLKSYKSYIIDFIGFGVKQFKTFLILTP